MRVSVEIQQKTGRKKRRTVDETFPSDSRARLLEVYTHEDVEVFARFVGVLLQELSVFERGFDILICAQCQTLMRSETKSDEDTFAKERLT